MAGESWPIRLVEYRQFRSNGGKKIVTKRYIQTGVNVRGYGRPTNSEDTLPLRISLDGRGGAGLLGVSVDIGEMAIFGFSSQGGLAKNSSSLGWPSSAPSSEGRPIKMRASRLLN